MKLLIIEGPDRVGKNLLIQNLISQSDNFIVRHFGTAKGDTDFEKRNHQYQFFKKEFTLASNRNIFNMDNKQRYPRDIWIMNRGHLGEFVYGKLYRNTNPDQWVFKMEEMFGFDIDPSVYLLLLTAPPQFLCSREDGKSFSSSIHNKAAEINAFKEAFRHSKIMNKKHIEVSNGVDYLDQSIILNEVNNFLNF